MRGFSTQERGELFHSFSFPGPDFPSHFLGFLNQSMIGKEKEACVIKEEGFQLKLGGGIWGWGVGKKTFSPFCPVSLNAPNFLLFAIFITVMLNVQNPSEFQLSPTEEKPAKQQIKRTMREWSFCYPRQRDHHSSKGHRRPFLSTALRSFLTGLEDSFKFG